MQVVLSASLDGGGGGRSLWLDERAIPSYVAAASLLVLFAHGVWSSKPVRVLRGVKTQKLPERERSWSNFLLERGGTTIWSFKVARLVGLLVLFWTWQVDLMNNEWTKPDAFVVATLLYASLLSLSNVLAASRRSLAYSRHLSLILVAVLAVYTYRDIWPLMTYTLQPKDSAGGTLLWVKLGLLFLVGVFLPLLEPYPYIPYDAAHPAPEPNPEQTASIAAFLTYVWLDALIWRARSVEHLSHANLPPLCDYDEIKNLVKRSYSKLDPMSGAKPKGHLFWSLIRIFKQSLFCQCIALVLIALSRIAVPIGTNRLLKQLENGGEGAVVKPWAWILLLGLGPLVKTLAWELYLFLSTRSLARVQAIFTSLIFDHTLRVRFKAETSEKSGAGASRSTSPTDDGSPAADSDEGDDGTVHSHAATEASTNASATSSATAVASASAQGKTKGDKKPDEEEDNKGDKGNNFAGKLNNLVTSDLDNILDGRHFLFIVLFIPLLGIFSMCFLYAVLGWSSFVGLAVMVVLFPAPSWVSAMSNTVQNEKMKATDARVQSVTETMSALRMIKLFGWENRVYETVAQKRDAEMKLVWKRHLLDLSNVCLANIFPLLHMVVTYAIYTIVMRRELTASVVFSSVMAFDMFRMQMGMFMYFLPSMISANVSLNRVAEFLRNTELLDTFTPTPPDEIVVESSWAHGSDIGFGKADFSWSHEKSDGAATPSRRAFRLSIDDEVKFKDGAFNLVIGPTGAGKTSVLMALLGEMHYMPRGPDSWVNLPRRGGVAFAAQESWVQNDTIRGNILFGAPYDEERYNKVIYQCGLTRDLSLFDAGDATEVGEKGITLSGGQKARITLARAVYSSAKMLLLDDVLAALDVHTSRWIVNKCFKGDLIRNRTVILVTHNIAMASPIADFVVALHDGRIVSQGTISDALKKDEQLAEEFEHDKEALELDENEEHDAEEQADPASAPTNKRSEEGKLVVAEEVGVGHVSWKAYKLFITALGGSWPLLFWSQYLGGSLLSDASTTFESWWLGYWARQYSLRDPSDVRVPFYLGMYVAIVMLSILAMVYSSLVYNWASMRASRVIHAKLARSLLGSTFRWLDVTPTSRVITRCTQDMQAVDGSIPNQLNGLIGSTLSLIVALVAVVLYTPMFLLPALVIAVLGGILGNMYIKAQLSIKREMSNAKAPVLGVFGSTTAGLTSIRAYAAQKSFKATIHERINGYTRASRSLYNVNRWISVRLDILGDMFTTSLAFYLVYATAANPSNVGFVLSVAATFSDQILWWVRTYNSFEVSSNSLERIQQYLEIEHEPEPTDAGRPPAYWPSSGELCVEKLSARYSQDGPIVLQDISFVARAGERIGVVGRTGSGKSTLTLAILRCIYTEGAVIYDGIPTHTLNLDALRSNITIIPQVPELLGGTLRHNLDMFEQHDDATLNDALRAAGLFSLQSTSDEHRLTLDSPIASGGGNLSVGQKQIIALARAIVRQSKLLILDEATSAIDYETDAVIQASLRTELKKDVTVITVAHRLQTIMDYDKILVLDAGRLVEFDAPKALLKKEGSLLRALVDESADRDALYAMAENKV